MNVLANKRAYTSLVLNDMVNKAVSGYTSSVYTCIIDDGVSVPSEWSEWTACDPPCDGSSYRNRSCDQPFPNNCSQINEVRPCTVDICNGTDVK